MSDLSRDTNDLLNQGRHGDALGADDKARLRRAILAQVAATSVVATTSTAAAWTAVTTKVVAAVVIVGSVAGGAALVASRRPSDVRAKAPVARVEVLAPVRPSVAVAAGAPAEPPPVTPLEPPASSDVARTEAHAGSVVAASEPPPRSALKSSREPVDVRDGRTPSPSARLARPSSLEEETRLLHEADNALKAGDGARALTLLAEHGARFPESALAPERAAERVFALCLVGRRDEARAAAAAFLGSEADGPLASRVRASCGGATP